MCALSLSSCSVYLFTILVCLCLCVSIKLIKSLINNQKLIIGGWIQIRISSNIHIRVQICNTWPTWLLLQILLRWCISLYHESAMEWKIAFVQLLIKKESSTIFVIYIWQTNCERFHLNYVWHNYDTLKCFSSQNLKVILQTVHLLRNMYIICTLCYWQGWISVWI